MLRTYFNIDYFNTLQMYPLYVSLLYTALYTAIELLLLVSQIEPAILYLWRKESIRDENIAYF